MSRNKVCVYAICKNEEQFVDRWMDSMAEADLVVVADTGSTDGTVEKLRARGATVHGILVKPWRFDVARNISLCLVPEDVDICVCTDLDEVLEAGWREKLEAAWKPGDTRVKYRYTWHFGPDGTPSISFYYEKIHGRRNFRWVHPVHEVLQYYGGLESVVLEEGIYLKHYPDPGKSRSQYLPLLEMSVREAPEDDRNMHYLGREYMYYGMWDMAISTLQRHLQMPRAQWKDERCASMRFIARCYKAKGQVREAYGWLYRAIAEAPHLRDPFIELARLAYDQRDWPTVFHMVQETLRITQRLMTYINEPAAWDHTPYDLGALSCYELGMWEKSLEYAKIAYDMSPGDPRLKSNYEIIKNQLEKRKTNITT